MGVILEAVYHSLDSTFVDRFNLAYKKGTKDNYRIFVLLFWGDRGV